MRIYHILLIIVGVLILAGITIGVLLSIQKPQDSTQQQITPTPTTTQVPTPNATTIPTLTSTPAPTTKPSQTPTATPTPSPTAAPQTYNIQIKGDEYCKTQTTSALNLLKSGAPNDYKNVTTYVGIIECTPAQSGMHVWETPPRYQVGELTYSSSTTWYAGTIVHDACHSMQYQRYMKDHQTSNVPYDAYAGEAAERECMTIQITALNTIGAPQPEIDHAKNQLDTEYWNIDYDKRYW